MTCEATIAIKKAKEHGYKGNYIQAITLLKKVINQSKSTEVTEAIRKYNDLLARKYWRQNRGNDLKVLVDGLPQEDSAPMRLSAARLQGKEALEALAKEEAGITSTLAECLLKPDLKKALLHLFRTPTHKSLAEGWISLLKGDTKRASEAFTKASDTTQLESAIGLGIVALAEGKIFLAKSLLAPLKSSASKLFPALSKALGWDAAPHSNNNTDIDTIKLQHYLTNASISELRNVEKSTSKHQTLLRSWICLRRGDLLAMQDKNLFTIHDWDIALKLNKDLLFDVLKRKYLFRISEDGLCDLYAELLSTNPAEAKLFIENLILNPPHNPSQIQLVNLLNEFKVDCTIELEFLDLYIANQHIIIQRNTLLPPRDFSTGIRNQFSQNCNRLSLADTKLSVELFQKKFLKLDEHYSDLEIYQRQKLNYYILAEMPQDMNITLIRLLKIAPHIKDEIFHYCVRYFTSLMNGRPLASELALAITQIKELKKLYPSDFDLVRFEIVLNKDIKNVEEILNSYRTQLQGPLMSVLRLQLMVDMSTPLAKCREYFPTENELMLSAEARWRFIALLLTPKLKFPKKELTSLIDRLYSEVSSKDKHLFFKKIFSHTCYTLPISTLRNWEKTCEFSDWRPYYHLFYHYFYEDDLEKMEKQIDQISIRQDGTFIDAKHLFDQFEILMQQFDDNYE